MLFIFYSSIVAILNVLVSSYILECKDTNLFFFIKHLSYH